MAKTIAAKKSLWERVCEEFEAEQPRPPGAVWTDRSSDSTQFSQYSSSKHSPVFYGLTTAKVFVDDDPLRDFDPLVAHPALAGYCLLEKVSLPHQQPPSTDLTGSSPQLIKMSGPVSTFLEKRVFPILIPGLEALLREAQKRGSFQREITDFNPCDFITEWLYNHNPCRRGQAPVHFLDIPFVKNSLIHPHFPPSSMSDDQASWVIQNFWRKHKARSRADVQELTPWQKKLRESSDIIKTVERFWAQQERRVFLTMRGFPRRPHAENLEVSIQVVSPSPQSTAAQTPTAQLTPDACEFLTPSCCLRDETGSSMPPMDFLSVSEPVGKPLAAVSPSSLAAHNLS